MCKKVGIKTCHLNILHFSVITKSYCNFFSSKYIYSSALSALKLYRAANMVLDFAKPKFLKSILKIGSQKFDVFSVATEPQI